MKNRKQRFQWSQLVGTGAGAEISQPASTEMSNKDNGSNQQPTEQLVEATLIEQESSHHHHTEEQGQHGPSQSLSSPSVRQPRLSNNSIHPDLVLVTAEPANSGDADNKGLEMGNTGKLIGKCAMWCCLVFIVALVVVGGIALSIQRNHNAGNSLQPTKTTGVASGISGGSGSGSGSEQPNRTTTASNDNGNNETTSSDKSPTEDNSSGTTLTIIDFTRDQPTEDPTTLEQMTSPSPLQLPTLSPTTSMEGHILSLLPNYTLEALQDPSSPQSRALDWLLYDHHPDTLTNYSETTTTTTTSRLLQRFALATFYYATNGIGWRFSRFWLSTNPDVHECTWWSHYEIPGSDADADADTDTDTDGTVCNDNHEYRAIALHHNVLIGTLPREIALLTSLETIILSADNFGIDILDSGKDRLLSGTFPSELGSLSRLTTLDMSKNAISGIIPSEIGQLTNLRVMKLVSE